MSQPYPRLCRVAVHADTAHVDLALPATVPISELLPAVIDTLAGSDTPAVIDTLAGRDTPAGSGAGRPSAGAAAPYRLARPGSQPLDSSKTLAQHAVRDGTVLLLTHAPEAAPGPRFHDPVAQAAETVRAVTRPWTAPAARCTGGLAAVGLAAVAGFVAVPGGPGAPNALVAAVAALAAVVLAMHLGAAGSVLTTACCLAALAVAVALAVLVTRASPQVIGAALAATAIGVLHGAGRLAIALTRLAPWPMQSSNHPEGKVIRAQHVLTGLVVASAAAAAAGALGTATGTHGDTGARFGGVAFGAVIGAALLLRARAHTDQAQIAALVGGGIAALGGSLVAAAATVPQHPLWLCATAGAASGIALHLGNRPALSPVTWRALELLEYPVLAAVAPLACWACGSYDAIRGLGLA